MRLLPLLLALALTLAGCATTNGDPRDPWEGLNRKTFAFNDALDKAVMKPLGDTRDRLYKEMRARIKETDESVPYRRHGYWYYQREVQGQQYPIYCRRKGTMEAPEATFR